MNFQSSIPEKRLNENEDSDDIGKEGHSQMEIDETPEDPIDAAGSTQVAKAVDRKLLPFGSGLLPTSSLFKAVHLVIVLGSSMILLLFT